MNPRVLKVGEKIYSQSLQHFDDSYLVGFPQRERQLLKHISGIKFEFFNHASITDISSITTERDRLNQYLSDKKYDYLFIDNPLSILVIDSKVNIPIIFDCIDWYEEMYLKEYGVNKQFFLLRYSLQETLDRVEKIIAQSPVILDSLKKWSQKEHQYEIVPNGYDKTIFYPYSNVKNIKIRQKLEKKYKCNLEGKKIVVYTGKLGYWYDNIKIIAQSIPQDFVFFIVGDGPISNQIPSQENIIKCGAVDLSQVPDFTNIADVLVFPVEVDCSPIAISEYLAVGKPIVMGKGRMEWLLKDGVTGCMVDNNVPSWRLGIEKASRMKKICSKNNLELAKDLSWQKLAVKFSKFIIQN